MKKVKVIFPDGSTAEVDESELQGALAAGAKRATDKTTTVNQKSTTMVFPDGSVADVSGTEVDGATKAGAIKKKASATPTEKSFNFAEDFSQSRSTSPSSSQTGKDINSFMQNPLVTGATDKLRQDIKDGKAITKANVDAVKLLDPQGYEQVAKEVLPENASLDAQTLITDVNNKVNTKAQGKAAETFLANYRIMTGGREYRTPEDLVALTPTQRIQLGVAQKGDYEIAEKEVIKTDLDTNFPILEPNAFQPWVKSKEDQLKEHDAIINDPNKTAEYLLRRQEVELQNESVLKPYTDRFSAESMNLGDENRDVSLDNPAGMQKYLSQRREKLNELNTVQGKINNLKNLAANAISGTVISDYLKSQGIEDINSPEAADLLATKDATAAIGFKIAQKSDARLSAQLSDITAAEQGRNNVEFGLGLRAGIADGEVKQVATDDNSLYKSLSETGDEKIQAQLRVQGYNNTLNYLAKNGYNEQAAKLYSKKDEVAKQNGKAVSDELWARLSSQRYIENDNNTAIGTWDATPENLRTWAGRAGFTPVEMSILEQDMIPDEQSRTITSNLQTSGFVNNAAEALGNTAVNFKNLFRDNASRTREILNENTGRLEDVGQYSPFLQELDLLNTKEKKEGLTPIEAGRKQMLLENTNLLNWWQQFKSGTGDLTGQVLGQALSAKGLDKIFKIGFIATAAEDATVAATTATGLEAGAAGIADNIMASPDIIAKAAKYINENKTLFLSSYTNAYDGYKKESLQLMPGAENEGKRTLYATMMSTFEGLSEKIFDDRKVLSSLGKEIKPVVREIVQDIEKGSLDKAAAIGKLQSVLAGGDYKKFIGTFLKNSNQEGIEEGVMDLAGDISKAIVLDQDYDITASLGGALKTYGSMVMNGGLVAGMAARGDVKNNTFNKSTLYNMASRPVDYKDEANRLLLSGDITQAEYNSKVAIINKATDAYAAMVKDGVVDKNLKNDAKNAAYLLHIVNQSVNEQFAEQASDPNVKKESQDNAERSKKISEGIYKNLVNVNEFLNPVAVNDVVAADLGIETPQQNIPTVVDENVTGEKTAAVVTAEDETLFNTILATPALTEIEKTNDLQYFVDKAGENPIEAENKFGKEVADQLLSKVPTEKLIENYKFIAKVDEQSPTALKLDEIIGERENSINSNNEEVNTPTVEASKADIERRRQEALQNDTSDLIPESTRLSVEEVNQKYDAEIAALPKEENNLTPIVSGEQKIKSNWNYEGEGDAFANSKESREGKSAYTIRVLDKNGRGNYYNRARQRGDLDTKSPLTYEGDRESVSAIDGNGNTVGVVKLQSDGGVEHIVVAPEFSRKGVASELIKQIEQKGAKVEFGKSKQISPEAASLFNKLKSENKPTTQKEEVKNESQATETSNAGNEPEKVDKPAVKTLAEKIRQLKSNKNNTYESILGIPVALWDGSIELVSKAIETGESIASAVKKGIAYLKENKVAFDESAYTERVTEAQETIAAQKFQQRNDAALQQLAKENGISFNKVLADFYKWVQTGVAEFKQFVKKYSTIIGSGIVLATTAYSNNAINEPQQVQQEKVVNGNRKKVIDIVNKYFGENNEIPPQEVVDRAVYLWETFGKPQILEDSTNKDERAYALTGTPIVLGNITNFDDFVAELSHAAQFTSTVPLDNINYETQAARDSIEYDRKGSAEYDAHKFIEPVIADFILNGNASEIKDSLPFFSDAKRSEAAEIIKKYSLADKIRSFKTEKRAYESILGIPVALYDGSLELIATAIEAGTALSKAIQKGIDFLKKEGVKFDEKEYKKIFEEVSKEETTTTELNNDFLRQSTFDALSVGRSEEEILGRQSFSDEQRTVVQAAIDNYNNAKKAVLDVIKQLREQQPDGTLLSDTAKSLLPYVLKDPALQSELNNEFYNYKPQTFEEAKVFAKNIIETLGSNGALQLLQSQSGVENPIPVIHALATFSELAKKFKEEGKSQQEAAALLAIRRIGTNSAQGLSGINLVKQLLGVSSADAKVEYYNTLVNEINEGLISQYNGELQKMNEELDSLKVDLKTALDKNTVLEDKIAQLVADAANNKTVHSAKVRGKRAAARLHNVADKIRKGLQNVQFSSVVPVSPSIIADAVDLVATLVEQGGNVIDAIQQAIESIKSKAKDFDGEDKFRELILKSSYPKQYEAQVKKAKGKTLASEVKDSDYFKNSKNKTISDVLNEGMSIKDAVEENFSFLPDGIKALIALEVEKQLIKEGQTYEVKRPKESKATKPNIFNQYKNNIINGTEVAQNLAKQKDVPYITRQQKLQIASLIQEANQLTGFRAAERIERANVIIDIANGGVWHSIISTAVYMKALISYSFAVNSLLSNRAASLTNGLSLVFSGDLSVKEVTKLLTNKDLRDYARSINYDVLYRGGIGFAETAAMIDNESHKSRLEEYKLGKTAWMIPPKLMAAVGSRIANAPDSAKAAKITIQNMLVYAKEAVAISAAKNNEKITKSEISDRAWNLVFSKNRQDAIVQADAEFLAQGKTLVGNAQGAGFFQNSKLLAAAKTRSTLNNIVDRNSTEYARRVGEIIFERIESQDREKWAAAVENSQNKLFKADIGWDFSRPYQKKDGENNFVKFMSAPLSGTMATITRTAAGLMQKSVYGNLDKVLFNGKKQVIGQIGSALNLMMFGFPKGAANFAEAYLDSHPLYAAFKIALLGAAKITGNKSTESRKDISRKQAEVVARATMATVKFAALKMAIEMMKQFGVCEDGVKVTIKDNTDANSKDGNVSICGYSMPIWLTGGSQLNGVLNTFSRIDTNDWTDQGVSGFDYLMSYIIAETDEAWAAGIEGQTVRSESEYPSIWSKISKAFFNKETSKLPQEAQDRMAQNSLLELSEGLLSNMVMVPQSAIKQSVRYGKYWFGDENVYYKKTFEDTKSGKWQSITDRFISGMLYKTGIGDIFEAADLMGKPALDYRGRLINENLKLDKYDEALKPYDVYMGFSRNTFYTQDKNGNISATHSDEEYYDYFEKCTKRFDKWIKENTSKFDADYKAYKAKGLLKDKKEYISGKIINAMSDIKKDVREEMGSKK